MKNLFYVAAAALTLSLAGCNYENSSPSIPYTPLLWSEVVTGSEVLRTTNTWGDADGMPRIVAAVQTRNGIEVYKDSGFKYESSYTANPTEFTRVVYSPAPATELYKNTYSDKAIQLTAEIFRNGETTASRWMKRELDSSGRITKQESVEGGVHTLFSNYVYGSSGREIYYDCAVTTDGVTVNTKVQELYDSNDRSNLTQREVFSGENRIELEMWVYDTGAYKKYVGRNITQSGSQLSGETLVIDQSAVSANVSNGTELQTSTRKEYDPETGALVKESTIRRYLELRYYNVM